MSSIAISRTAQGPTRPPAADIFSEGLADEIERTRHAPCAETIAAKAELMGHRQNMLQHAAAIHVRKGNQCCSGALAVLHEAAEGTVDAALAETVSECDEGVVEPSLETKGPRRTEGGRRASASSCLARAEASRLCSPNTSSACSRKAACAASLSPRSMYPLAPSTAAVDGSPSRAELLERRAEVNAPQEASMHDELLASAPKCPHLTELSGVARQPFATRLVVNGTNFVDGRAGRRRR
eukprot:CAMPEP_0119351956 /NCGR_PEP_ID=MMETSP1334-20130426/1232_1 /TAXON_ID=127549 /ORGANISM="Calcidiscus leptoporus, Strain RCC1130" /LENGTH=238 /DNA_ID=CAMNT_0007364877 /DNA_START=156 /DNA_END=874 /DNA_ORIENTATION=-